MCTLYRRMTNISQCGCRDKQDPDSTASEQGPLATEYASPSQLRSTSERKFPSPRRKICGASPPPERASGTLHLWSRCLDWPFLWTTRQVQYMYSKGNLSLSRSEPQSRGTNTLDLRQSVFVKDLEIESIDSNQSSCHALFFTTSPWDLLFPIPTLILDQSRCRELSLFSASSLALSK